MIYLSALKNWIRRSLRVTCVALLLLLSLSFTADISGISPLFDAQAQECYDEYGDLPAEDCDQCYCQGSGCTRPADMASCNCQFPPFDSACSLPIPGPCDDNDPATECVDCSDIQNRKDGKCQEFCAENALAVGCHDRCFDASDRGKSIANRATIACTECLCDTGVSGNSCDNSIDDGQCLCIDPNAGSDCKKCYSSNDFADAIAVSCNACNCKGSGCNDELSPEEEAAKLVCDTAKTAHTQIVADMAARKSTEQTKIENECKQDDFLKIIKDRVKEESDKKDCQDADDYNAAVAQYKDEWKKCVDRKNGEWNFICHAAQLAADEHMFTCEGAVDALPNECNYTPPKFPDIDCGDISVPTPDLPGPPDKGDCLCKDANGQDVKDCCIVHDEEKFGDECKALCKTVDKDKKLVNKPDCCVKKDDNGDDVEQFGDACKTPVPPKYCDIFLCPVDHPCLNPDVCPVPDGDYNPCALAYPPPQCANNPCYGTNPPAWCEPDPDDPPGGPCAPGDPSCEPNCQEDPSQAHCQPDPAPDCASDPTLAGCPPPLDPTCEDDPTLAGCPPPLDPTCEDDPTLPECNPTCEEDPSAAGCGCEFADDPEACYCEEDINSKDCQCLKDPGSLACLCTTDGGITDPDPGVADHCACVSTSEIDPDTGEVAFHEDACCIAKKTGDPSAAEGADCDECTLADEEAGHCCTDDSALEGTCCTGFDPQAEGIHKYPKKECPGLCEDANGEPIAEPTCCVKDDVEQRPCPCTPTPEEEEEGSSSSSDDPSAEPSPYPAQPPALPADNRYRDLCISGADIKQNWFDRVTGNLLDGLRTIQINPPLEGRSALMLLYGSMAGSKSYQGECVPMKSTPTIAAENANPFSFFLNIGDMHDYKDPKTKRTPQWYKGRDDDIRAATILVGGRRSGCIDLMAPKNLEALRKNPLEIMNFRRAQAFNCAAQYVLGRAKEPWFVYEPPGSSLYEIAHPVWIASSYCQPLAGGNDALAVEQGLLPEFMAQMAGVIHSEDPLLNENEYLASTYLSRARKQTFYDELRHYDDLAEGNYTRKRPQTDQERLIATKIKGRVTLAIPTACIVDEDGKPLTAIGTTVSLKKPNFRLYINLLARYLKEGKLIEIPALANDQEIRERLGELADWTRSVLSAGLGISVDAAAQIWENNQPNRTTPVATPSSSAADPTKGITQEMLDSMELAGQQASAALDALEHNGKLYCPDTTASANAPDLGHCPTAHPIGSTHNYYPPALLPDPVQSVWRFPYYCPNVESIKDPTHPFSPRHDIVDRNNNPVSVQNLKKPNRIIGTDREWSHFTSIKMSSDKEECKGMDGDYSYTDFSLIKNVNQQLDQAPVQCAAVPVDILSYRHQDFKNCMGYRIEKNHAWWSKYVEAKDTDKGFKPPCATQYDKEDISYPLTYTVTKEITVTVPCGARAAEGTRCTEKKEVERTHTVTVSCDAEKPVGWCCNRITKPVVPMNHQKIRTCDPVEANEDTSRIGSEPFGTTPSANLPRLKAQAAARNKCQVPDGEVMAPKEYHFGHWFSTYSHQGQEVGAHMPYMRWWDTGAAAGMDRKGGSFINTLGSYDVLVGVGREARNQRQNNEARQRLSTINRDKTPYRYANNLEPQSRQAGNLIGWDGLVQEQMYATRNNNVACIPRAEKLSKPKEADNYGTYAIGGFYKPQKGGSKPWPFGWRGHSSDPDSEQQWKSNLTNFDQVAQGDIVFIEANGIRTPMYVEMVSFPPAFAQQMKRLLRIGLDNDLRYNQTNSQWEVRSSGGGVLARTPYIESMVVKTWNDGKFPSASGVTTQWGYGYSKTIHRNRTPSTVNIPYDRPEIRGLSARIGDMPSCADPDYKDCALPEFAQWKNGEVFRPALSARPCEAYITHEKKRYRLDDPAIKELPASAIDASLLSKCVADGFDPPVTPNNAFRNGYGAGDAGVTGTGVNTKTQFCLPHWRSCSIQPQCVYTTWSMCDTSLTPWAPIFEPAPQPQPNSGSVPPWTYFNLN